MSEARPQRGPEGIRQSMAYYLRAFSDLHFTEEATLTQDDRIALFWTARGTHRWKLMNIPPIEYIKERALLFQQIQA